MKNKAKDAGKDVTVNEYLVDGALDILMSGDVDKHNELVINAINRAISEINVEFAHIKKKYEEALPYLAKWVDMLDEMVAKDKAGEELSTKDRDRVNRKAFCYYMYA